MEEKQVVGLKKTIYRIWIACGSRGFEREEESSVDLTQDLRLSEGREGGEKANVCQISQDVVVLSFQPFMLRFGLSRSVWCWIFTFTLFIAYSILSFVSFLFSFAVFVFPGFPSLLSHLLQACFCL